MSKPGPSAFQRLGLLLRQRLLPLYRIFPILGIRYSVAVLVAIHSEKMVTASKFQKPIDREPWEVVLSSLLSGILVNAHIATLQSNTSDHAMAIGLS